MDNRQDFESWDGGSNPSLGVLKRKESRATYIIYEDVKIHTHLANT